MFATEPGFLVIGHRGAAGELPENTLPSFERAYAAGCHAVELDVHVVEGQLVVIHDTTVDRTTNGAGAVADFTLRGLRQLNAGNGSHVPTLDEVLTLTPPGVGINIELKGKGSGTQLADQLADCNYRHKTIDILVSSFDHRELGLFHALAPSTATAPLYHRWVDSVWTTAAAVGAWAIHLNHKIVTAPRVMRAREKGLEVLAYTVNSTTRANTLRNMGVKGIFTDYPSRLIPAVPGD